ncbi:MAG TPA: hypothetical protein VHR17_06145 [Thermoanaerobaculia bacterium]|nr:hypothetical protein [Thermoanaerobaculia bacterium]
MTAFLPALLVGLFAIWSGTFHGGAGWTGALAGDVAVVAFALAAAPRWRDPLALGRGGEVLLWALLAAVGASVVASPVPRAGLESLAVLPAFLLAPAAVERSWSTPVRRRRGCRALTLVVVAAAAWALVDAISGGAWRAVALIGHHGALAAWLLFVLPFGVLTARERGPWRGLGVLAIVAAGATILATRSLVAAALLAVQVGMLWPRRRGRWWALASVAALVAVANAPRLIAIVTGGDPSVAARRSYLSAGWLGLRARPALGWGPGSVGWTVGEHLRPAPGRNPPGEVVSYLHFLPLDLAYQLGVAGALLAAAVVAAFLVARRSERATADDPHLFDASMAALVPGLAALCLAGFQPLPAATVAAAVAAGAMLASTTTCRPAVSDRARRAARAAILLYSAIALGVLAPVRRAQRLYDEARTAGQPFELLVGATDYDKSFPLYAARRAWASAPLPTPATGAVTGGTDESRIAGEALRAAERAPGVAALWLAAGLLGADANAPWAEAALRRACDLDPLGALAPFQLMTLGRGEHAAAVAGARAMLAEPRLAAALEWEGRDALYQRAIDEIRGWPGIASNWRFKTVSVLASLPPLRSASTSPFALELDGEAQTSLSLFVFRRLPWPTTLGSIDLDRERLRQITVGSAALRADTAPWAFPTNECGRPESPR